MWSAYLCICIAFHNIQPSVGLYCTTTIYSHSHSHIANHRQLTFPSVDFPRFFHKMQKNVLWLQSLIHFINLWVSSIFQKGDFAAAAAEPAVDIVCVSIMFIFNYNSGWFPLPAATVPALSAAVLTAQWNQWPISDVIGTNGGSFAGKYEPPSHSRQ